MLDKKIVQKFAYINRDEALKLKMEDFKDLLIDGFGIFVSEKDLKLFILNMIEKVFKEENASFPIRYYQTDEKAEKAYKELQDKLNSNVVQEKITNNIVKKFK